MEVKSNLKSGLSRLSDQARRIFNITYEDMSVQIYYDLNNSYRINIELKNQSLLEREISRMQAFRLMNTRR